MLLASGLATPALGRLPPHGRPSPEEAAFSSALARPFSLAPPSPHASTHAPPPAAASLPSAAARAVPPVPCQHATPHAPPPAAALLPSATACAVPPVPYQHAVPHAPPPNAASLSSATVTAVPPAARRKPAADPPHRTARPHPHASISCDTRSPSSSIRHPTHPPQVTHAYAPATLRHAAAAHSNPLPGIRIGHTPTRSRQPVRLRPLTGPVQGQPRPVLQ